MRISAEKPPIYEEAKKLFNLKEGQGTVFTYGDCVYNPDGIDMPEHLIVHEMEHAKQQEHNDTVAGLWWKRVLADPAFRVDQEARAYGAQYAYIRKRVKDRNKCSGYLLEMSQMLSGPMYGNCVSRQEAQRLIRLYSGQ